MIVAANAKGVIIDAGELNYVRREERGWEPCAPDEAEAIAVHNVIYSLGEPIVLDTEIDTDGNETERMAPVATIYEVPDESLTVEALGLSKTHDGQISDLESGLMEVADAVADSETALIEISDMLGTLNEHIEQLLA